MINRYIRLLVLRQQVRNNLMTILSSVILRGTRSGQPAAGTPGRLYYVTDESVTERDSGTAWQNYSDAGTGGGGGAWTQIGTEIILGSTTATFTFTSIPGTYGALQLRILGRSDRSGQSLDSVNIQFNSDSGSNYDFTEFRGDSSTTGASTLATTSIIVGYQPGATAQANTAGSFVVEIPYYAATTFYKNVISQGRDEEANATNSTRSMLFTGTWKSTAAITSITISCLSNYIAGSRASLFGLTIN